MLSEKQIQAAVDWWVHALEDPQFDMLGSTRQAERERGGATVEFAEVMATVGAAKGKSDRLAKLQPFGDALRQCLNKDDGTIEHMGLSVDYGPDRALADAARAAGLDPGSIMLFPWKTRMRFASGGVQVSHGYGAPYQELVNKT